MGDDDDLDAKFIAVGWKKTGTTSLALAFHLLGIGPQCKCRSVHSLARFRVTSDVNFCCYPELALEASQQEAVSCNNASQAPWR